MAAHTTQQLPPPIPQATSQPQFLKKGAGAEQNPLECFLMDAVTETVFTDQNLWEDVHTHTHTHECTDMHARTAKEGFLLK